MLAGRAEDFLSPNYFLFLVVAFLPHLGPPRGRGRGRDRTALLRQGTQRLGPSSPDTPDSHLPRWWGEKWGKNWGKMGENGEKWGFCVIWGPRWAWSGSGSHRPFRAGYPGSRAIFPRHARHTFTPMVGRKMGQNGENGVFASFGGPRGGVVGVGARRPFGTGYPGSWDTFCLGHNTPIPRLLWVKNGSQGGPAQKNCRSSAGARKN